MNIFIYIILFITGTVFGSFLTLATYRIPLNQDITHKHSYCPKCNHLLSFLDLIPLLSYIFLGGKCRYCKAKISPRYFLIELSSGISFVLLGLALNFNIETISINKIIELWLGILYIVFIFLVGQIDKEKNYIDDRVLIYGTVIATLNVVFQYFNDSNFNINRILIYLIILIIIIAINILKSKKNKTNNYALNATILTIIMNMFIYEIPTILIVISTLLIVSIKLLINKIVNKGKKHNKKLPIAFYMCISNVIVLLMM